MAEAVVYALENNLPEYLYNIGTGKDITIKEISQKITFPAQFENDGELFYANATLKIDRTKHDIKYGSGSFFDDLGDRMIYDEFTLKIHLQGSKVKD